MTKWLLHRNSTKLNVVMIKNRTHHQNKLHGSCQNIASIHHFWHFTFTTPSKNSIRMLSIGRLLCKLMAPRETAGTIVNIRVANHFSCLCINTVLMTQLHQVLRMHIDFYMTHQLVSPLNLKMTVAVACQPVSTVSTQFYILHFSVITAWKWLEGKNMYWAM